MTSSFPNNWAVATIGDVTRSPEQRQPQVDEEFLYIDISSIDRETKKIVNPQRMIGDKAPSRARQVVQAGDVLVSMTRPNLNAVAMVSNELSGNIASTGFDVLRPNEVESRWLFNIVRSRYFVEVMSELVQGALYPAVRPRDIRGYEMPLAPLNEQIRIDDKLDALLVRVDACRERLDRVPQVLKRFRQAVLSAATSGELTEEWRAGRRNLDQWKSVHLRDLAVLITKGASPKWQGFSYVASGTLFVTSENVREMKIDVTEPKYVEPSFNSVQRRSVLQKGDLLTNIVGASIGRTAIFDLDAPANINQAVCVIRLKNEIEKRFVMYALSSPKLIQHMHGEKVDVARANLSLVDVGNFPLLIPNVEEQHEIVRRVETLFAFADRLEARYTAARKQVDQLTPSLLAKAFRGELVPQDPDDEPAEKLLDRIRAAHVTCGNTEIKARRSKMPVQKREPS